MEKLLEKANKVNLVGRLVLKMYELLHMHSNRVVDDRLILGPASHVKVVHSQTENRCKCIPFLQMICAATIISLCNE